MLLRMFGIGISAAIAGEQAEGTVTEVKTCYWFKINTKPVRRHMWDGAVYPHIIHFTYEVDGTRFSGRRFVWYNRRCPVKGEKITIHYEVRSPEKFAVIV